ncbi:MAG: hypothetical protein M3237_23660 [Actinomycetota bacterium]|nr:hypothetical protein [Actinomycetota bacterium]
MRTVGKWLAALLGPAALGAALGSLSFDSLPVPVALAALAIGGCLVIALLVADRRGGTLPWLVHDTPVRITARWLSLASLVVASAALGPRASLPDADSGDIIRAELAFSQQRFDAIESMRGFATAVHWDFAFIPAYVLLLGLLVCWTGSYYRLERVRAARHVVVLAVAAAGLLDAVENLAMLQEWWPVAATAAWGKFAILVVAIGYVWVGFLSWLTTPQWLRVPIWNGVDPIRSKDEGELPPSAAGLGIALSGGGIRAASLSLGALQTLERESRGRLGDPIGWGRATSVTAVSGGSNLAAGWSLSRSWQPASPEKTPSGWEPPPDDPKPWSRAGEQVPLSPEERHLMDNLGYLLSNNPRASEGTVAARQPVRPSVYATVLAGFVLNATLLLTVLWLVVRPLGWMFEGYRGWQGGEPGDHGFLVARPSLMVPALAYVALGLGVLLLWVAVGQWLARGSDTRRGRRAFLLALRGLASGSLALGAVLVAVLVVLPALMWLTSNARDSDASLITLAGSLGSLGAVVRLLRKPAAKYLPMLGGVLFLVLVLFLAAYWAAGAAESRGELRPDALWWVALGVLAFVYLAFSPEQWSLAAFYRGKLRLAYALYRAGDTTVRPFQNSNISVNESEWEPELHEIPTVLEAEHGTPLVICATTTTSSRRVRTHYNIPAMSVTFDPGQVRVFVPRDDHGAWDKYEAGTEAYGALGRRSGKRLTTMLAVAIASAAVSPAMGRMRIGPTSMLMTFANVRLGVWMPHPGYAAASEAAGGAGYPRTRLSYLLKEFFGIHAISDPYLYMTDGGHWENTGLVELLRRTDISEVVCVDADSGPGDATGSISKAIDLAALECGVRVHLNLDPLRAKLAGTRAPDYCKRNLNLGFFTRTGHRQGDEGPAYGVLWYTKPGLTETMPAALLAYRELNASYPRIGTVDQFFDTATYVAYRDLGRYNATQVRLARVELIRLLDGVAELPDARAAWNFVARPGHGDPAVSWVRDELQCAIEVFVGSERTQEFCAAIRASLVQPSSRRRGVS